MKNMNNTFEINSIEGLSEVSRCIVEMREFSNIVAFYGPMGAGKTTLIKNLCHSLGVVDEVNSPTFALVNEYVSRKGEPIYHFDFYRITRTAEALDIGFYDYIDSGCLCIMEWPENIEEIIPEETLRVRISVSPDGSRVLSWED